MAVKLGKWSDTNDVIRKFRADAETLKSQSIIITGSNTGIGKETAQALISLGANLILACRNTEKAKQAGDDISMGCQSPHGTVNCLGVDLASVESVQRFVKNYRSLSESRKWPPLTMLILNGGVYPFGGYRATQDGFETTFATNHLGHYLLTTLLLPDLKRTPRSRVIVVSSDSHYGPLIAADMCNKTEVMNSVVVASEPSRFVGSNAYGSSKLCNALFAGALHRRESGNAGAVGACSLHPGTLIGTDIARASVVADFFMKYIVSWFTKTPNQGAATTVYCCLLPWDELQGQYFCDCNTKNASDVARNVSAQDVLWEVSASLVANGSGTGTAT